LLSCKTTVQHRVRNYDSIKAFSETDFTEDLKNFDVPTLVPEVG